MGMNFFTTGDGTVIIHGGSILKDYGCYYGIMEHLNNGFLSLFLTNTDFHFTRC